MLALALLVLSMVARPVLAAIGEAHELAHDPSGRHVHVAEAGGTAADAAPEERSVGHALLHFAHCCAQLSVAMADGLFKLQSALDARRCAFGLDLQGVTSTIRPSRSAGSGVGPV